MLAFLCAAFARIRRLSISPQYLLAILQWKMAVSANIHKTSTQIAQKEIKSWLAKFPIPNQETHVSKPRFIFKISLKLAELG